MDKFIVKHYSSDEYPCIKGNGFDGTTVGDDREDAEEFIDFINEIIQQLTDAKARIVELEKTINEILDIIEPCLHKWEDADPTDCIDGEVCYQCNTIRPKA